MNLLTKLRIALKKIVYIRLCLYIIQVHEQFTNHHKLLVNVCELGGNLFCKVPYMHLTNMYSVDDNITCWNYQYIEFMEDP